MTLPPLWRRGWHAGAYAPLGPDTTPVFYPIYDSLTTNFSPYLLFTDCVLIKKYLNHKKHQNQVRSFSTSIHQVVRLTHEMQSLHELNPVGQFLKVPNTNVPGPVGAGVLSEPRGR